MNNSVDYQIELHLKNLEDELKTAEQQYLERLQSIVAKYTNRATELREQSLKEYENYLSRSNTKKQSPATSNQDVESIPKQTPQQTQISSPIRENPDKDHLNLNNELTKKKKAIEITSPIEQSGYTPTYVKKIRQSLKRGQMLYKINQSKDNSQSMDIIITEDKENRNDNALELNTSNNTIMTNQAIIDHHEDDDKENHD
eukprot:CAMPEP_0201594578 /NCGR_PEP_ID=MMETSP0190_2-20130828/191853_1 /ASSEMBLY_ACC=CAM_ASM_000263 /TAXON_ID=37353 /ORGANISM="Rosalina sp." /LENGTH=199 /DNA_ID=CAMNT_0048054247 /DNA_START=25 /DNA_END=625 /DNA_ORIENTATION=-